MERISSLANPFIIAENGTPVADTSHRNRRDVPKAKPAPVVFTGPSSGRVQIEKIPAPVIKTDYTVSEVLRTIAKGAQPVASAGELANQVHHVITGEDLSSGTQQDLKIAGQISDRALAIIPQVAVTQSAFRQFGHLADAYDNSPPNIDALEEGLGDAQNMRAVASSRHVMRGISVTNRQKSSNTSPRSSTEEKITETSKNKEQEIAGSMNMHAIEIDGETLYVNKSKDSSGHYEIYKIYNDNILPYRRSTGQFAIFHEGRWQKSGGLKGGGKTVQDNPQLHQERSSGNFTLDITAATPKEGSTSSTANAGSVWTLENGEEFFVKTSVAHLMKGEKEVNGNWKLVYERAPTIAEQKFFVEREVVATRQTALQALHEHAAPEAFVATKLVTDNNGETITEYFVSTKLPDNFQELGDILVDGNFVKEQLTQQKMAPDIQVRLKEKVNQLRQLQKEFQDLKKANPKWYMSTDPNLQNKIGVMRELRKEVVNQLLPEKLRNQLLAHVMNDQVIGELDTINIWGENVGLMKQSSGEWQLVAIDRGASYDIGFWGTAKDRDGFSTAKGQRPYILQSDKEQFFTQQSAKYSAELPSLGKDFSNYPYPEDIETIAGAGINDMVRLEILKKLAYQDLLLEGKGNTDSAFNKNFDLLSDPPTAGLKERGLMTKNEVIEIDKARRDARIDQAGGKDTVLRWAHENPVEANRIKNLANAKREKMGLPNNR